MTLSVPGEHAPDQWRRLATQRPVKLSTYPVHNRATKLFKPS